MSAEGTPPCLCFPGYGERLFDVVNFGLDRSALIIAETFALIKLYGHANDGLNSLRTPPASGPSGFGLSLERRMSAATTKHPCPACGEFEQVQLVDYLGSVYQFRCRNCLTKFCVQGCFPWDREM